MPSPDLYDLTNVVRSRPARWPRLAAQPRIVQVDLHERGRRRAVHVYAEKASGKRTPTLSLPYRVPFFCRKSRQKDLQAAAVIEALGVLESSLPRL